MGLFDDILQSRAGQGLLGLMASGASEDEIAQQLASTQRLKGRIATTPSVQSAMDAFLAPQRAYRGELQTVDPMTGRTSDAAVEAGLGVAGIAATGGLGGLGGRPVNSLGMFGGRMAKTADRAALAKAEELAAKGAPREQIWNETGWFQGPDGKWRFEIDDSASALHSKALDELDKHVTHGASQRSAVGTLHHDKLYAAYPQLRQIDVDARYNTELKGHSGEYSNQDGRPRIKVQANALAGPDGVPSLLLHELQHPIQHLEGFANGSDLGRAGGSVDRYLRAGGEVEARNVQARRDMTPEQRRETPPWLTQDMPDDQILLDFLLRK